MLKSSRVSRAVRNGLVLGAAAAAAVGLTGCKAVPSFNLDSAASGIHVTGTNGSGGPTGVSSQAGSETGSGNGTGAGAGTGTAGGSTGHKGAGTGSPTGSQPAGGQPPSGHQPLPGQPAPGAPVSGQGMIVGTVDGGHDAAVAGTGIQLPDHQYSQFNQKVPAFGAMYTVAAAQTPWAQVAQAGPGSSLYNDIVRWAQTLKTRGHIMVAYDHEPEAATHNGLGTSADYIAAYRHVVDIFRQQGATNIEWTWQMTGNAFRVKPSDPRYAAKWYPGDDVVDNVGSDTYNFYTCAGGSTWQQLEPLATPTLDFARAHGKKASFPEYGALIDPRRVDWLASAHQFFAANADVLDAVFYFNHPPRGTPCHWYLNSAAEFAQLRAMAQDPALVAR